MDSLFDGLAENPKPAVAKPLAPARAASTPPLRPYQSQMVADFWERVQAGDKSILLVLQTGGGKTRLCAEIIDQSRKKGWKVLFLAHRRELVSQASKTLHASHIDHGIIQAGFPSRLHEPVQVASIQTVHARAVRSSAIEMPDFNVVVVDEAHRILGTTYRQILNQYPDAIVIGLTATPCRSDGRGLGNVFDWMVVGPEVEDLIAGGYLVGTRTYAPTTPDLKGVKVERGDYAEGQLAERMDTQQLVGDVVTHWLKLGEGRQTIAFATSVAHSAHLRDEFQRAGVMADHLDGTTPSEEREAILRRLAIGETQVLVNCQVLTEGFDSPNVGCIILARPTKSVALYRQMVGRGLRPAAAKENLILLDHAGAVFEHGFIDEPIQWTLKDNERAENKRQEARKAGSAPKLVACPECSAINWQGRPCSACGWRPRVKAAGVEVKEGELGEVDRKTRKARKGASEWQPQEFYGMLLSICESRGYKPGWAYYKFKEKFPGQRPAADAQPIPPTPAMMSWIRSRQIAWSKARSR